MVVITAIFFSSDFSFFFVLFFKNVLFVRFDSVSKAIMGCKYKREKQKIQLSLSFNLLSFIKSIGLNGIDRESIILPKMYHIGHKLFTNVNLNQRWNRKYSNSLHFIRFCGLAQFSPGNSITSIQFLAISCPIFIIKKFHIKFTQNCNNSELISESELFLYSETSNWRKKKKAEFDRHILEIKLKMNWHSNVVRNWKKSFMCSAIDLAWHYERTSSFVKFERYRQITNTEHEAITDPLWLNVVEPHTHISTHTLN